MLSKGLKMGLPFVIRFNRMSRKPKAQNINDERGSCTSFPIPRTNLGSLHIVDILCQDAPSLPPWTQGK